MGDDPELLHTGRGVLDRIKKETVAQDTPGIARLAREHRADLVMRFSRLVVSKCVSDTYLKHLLMKSDYAQIEKITFFELFSRFFSFFSKK